MFALTAILCPPPSYFSDLLSDQPRDRVLRDAYSYLPMLIFTLSDLYRNVCKAS
jgi:hypothetical protein